MKGRINDKINEIEKFLGELEPSLPTNFEEYKKDYRIRAIGERYFEKIVKAIIDLAFIIVKEKNFKQPEYEKQVFEILADNNIISQELSKKLQDAKGMRNIITHEYGKNDNELVIKSITKEIKRDANEYINLDKKI